MRTRTDPHRPGAIIPTDYEHLLSYETDVPMAINLGGDRWVMVKGTFAVDCTRENDAKVHRGGDRCCVARLRESRQFFHGGSLQSCSVCGAWFKAGDVWVYRPTGECIYLGHTCADKYQMYADRAAWLAWHKGQTQMRAAAIKAELHKKARLEAEAAAGTYRAARPDLDAALRVEHPILQDMAGKLVRFGSLSEKQIAFALKLANEVQNPPPAEQHVPAPTGRVTFKGEVISVKAHESDFGTVTKITVKVSTPAGTWFAWITRPAGFPYGAGRGTVVEVAATLTPGRDPYFALGKRPILKHVESDGSPAASLA